MRYNVGDKVVVNLRSLNPDMVPEAPWPEASGVVVERREPGLYAVRLDVPVQGFDLLEDLGESRLMAAQPE